MIRTSTLLTAMALCAAPAAAQDSPPVAGNEVTIGSSGSNSGVTTVNSAAGNQNQQVNVGVIGGGGTSLSGASATQHLDVSGAAGGAPANTSIAAAAFAGFGGWVAVNGVSGNANQQANLAAFAFGIEAGAATDISLAQTRASMEPTGSDGTSAASDPQRSVVIGEGAFEDGSGLVQVSLIGGDRNSSANTFALSVSLGAKP